jgi:hypothetical protein
MELFKSKRRYMYFTYMVNHNRAPKVKYGRTVLRLRNY